MADDKRSAHSAPHRSPDASLHDVSRLHQRMAVNDGSGPEPRPDTLSALRGHLRARNRKRRNRSFRTVFARLGRMRIPAYPAAAGLLLAGVLIVHVQWFGGGGGSDPERPVEVMVADSTGRADSLSGPGGRSLFEDSLLARFRTSVM